MLWTRGIPRRAARPTYPPSDVSLWGAQPPTLPLSRAHRPPDRRGAELPTPPLCRASGRPVRRGAGASVPRAGQRRAPRRRSGGTRESRRAAPPQHLRALRRADVAPRPEALAMPARSGAPRVLRGRLQLRSGRGRGGVAPTTRNCLGGWVGSGAQRALIRSGEAVGYTLSVEGSARSSRRGSAAGPGAPSMPCAPCRTAGPPRASRAPFRRGRGGRSPHGEEIRRWVGGPSRPARYPSRPRHDRARSSGRATRRRRRGSARSSGRPYRRSRGRSAGGAPAGSRHRRGSGARLP